MPRPKRNCQQFFHYARARFRCTKPPLETHDLRLNRFGATVCALTPTPTESSMRTLPATYLRGRLRLRLRCSLRESIADTNLLRTATRGWRGGRWTKCPERVRWTEAIRFFVRCVFSVDGAHRWRLSSGPYPVEDGKSRSSLLLLASFLSIGTIGFSCEITDFLFLFHFSLSFFLPKVIYWILRIFKMNDHGRPSSQASGLKAKI